jgi:homoserine kinase
MTIRAYAPASIGNFAAGFDLLGAAVAPLDGALWGDVVSAEPASAASAASLTLSGRYAGDMPADPWQNLVLRTYGLFRDALAARAQSAGAAGAGAWPVPAFHLEKNLPRSSGLGSSSSSVAATLTACQRLVAEAGGEPLAPSELFALAGRAEGLVSGTPHLDNVVPALLGGLQLLVPGRADGDGTPEARALPWSDDLVLVLALPRFELPTVESRAALPPCFKLGETLAFAQNLAGFVHALESGDRGLLRRCLRDVLTEPHRAGLVPGFRAAQAAALARGALGCGLSGSGPATFAVAESRSQGEEIAGALQEGFAAAGLASEVHACRLDRRGARLLSEGRLP